MLQSVIYYTVRSPKLDHWLNHANIMEGLTPTLDKNYVDLDPTFNMQVDEDFDFRLAGVSRNSFCGIYLDWIQYCASRRDKVWTIVFQLRTYYVGFKGTSLSEYYYYYLFIYFIYLFIFGMTTMTIMSQWETSRSKECFNRT